MSTITSTLPTKPVTLATLMVLVTIGTTRPSQSIPNGKLTFNISRTKGVVTLSGDLYVTVSVSLGASRAFNTCRVTLVI